MGVVIPLKDQPDPAAKLKPLLNLTEAEMLKVNQLITERARSDVETVPELARHLIDSGGKRLRPMLAIASAKLFGYSGTDHITTAAAIEFLHTATLLHDDVVDESDTRRGKKTARLIWGNQASVLVGDFLLGQSFLMLVEAGSLHILRILSQAASTIAEGEVMQLIAANNTATTEDEYLAIINAKTATLFSAATEAGATLNNRPSDEAAALRSYGKNLGLAFQLVDDALDYSGDSQALGKSVGDDFREGKITLPVILAFRRGDQDERAFWNRTVAERKIEDGDLAEAMALMKKYDALDATFERARSYGAIARDALEIFDDGPEKSAMLDIIAFCIERRN